MRRPLEGVAVLEYGDRLAVSACGAVLASLGARVSTVASDANAIERLPAAQTQDKQRLRHGDLALASALVSADVVVTSSDVSPVLPQARPPAQIICDITAYGSSGPFAGIAHSDALVQAMSGLADTTGEPEGPPTLCPFPQTEGIAALYAAAGILAAWLVRMRTGLGQAVEIALFDCAFSTLSTFLPFHFVGKPVTRSGNRHVLASPWNAYRASDGWLLICTGADEQWRRLCEVIARPELARDPKLAKATDRVQQRAVVDGAVQAWIARLRVADAAEALQARGIAAGPVVPVEGLESEPNIAHRGLFGADGMRSAIRYFAMLSPALRKEMVSDGRTAAQTISPSPPTPLPEGEGSSGAPITLSEGRGSSARLRQVLPLPPGEGSSSVPTHTSLLPPGEGQGVREIEPPGPPNILRAPPLAGLRVLEIGQYTTAPLVARNLGALGADVLKIEPPGGDAARDWPPQQHGQGYFFTLSNSDKRSVCLDLRDPGDRERFATLLRDADVLVENLKPGSLDKLGFDAAAREAINPRLVYCAISGFGADSAYPGRPAFDTVVQAMSGIMDSIRVNGMPQKAGISFADILGGLFALVGTFSALVDRGNSGAGAALDISMQDAAAWITQWQRAGRDGTHNTSIVQFPDGYVVIEGPPPPETTDPSAGLTRSSAMEPLARRGIRAAPVCSIAEVAESAQVRERRLLRRVRDSAGREWLVFACPIHLSTVTASAQSAIGPLGEAGEEGFSRMR